jgi:hypothetical protein
MKLTRRLIYWAFFALIVIPFGMFVCGVIYPDSKSLSTTLVGLSIPTQVLATLSMLVWCAICLKVDPALSRIGILLAAFTLIVVYLFVG